MLQYMLGYFAQNQPVTYTLLFKCITKFGPILYMVLYYFGVKSHDSRPLSCLVPKGEEMVNMENLGAFSFGSSEWRLAIPKWRNNGTKKFEFDQDEYDFSHLQ